ncbi:hypothetical protein FKM82_013134 [Ascaphus truei]
MQLSCSSSTSSLRRVAAKDVTGEEDSEAVYTLVIEPTPQELPALETVAPLQQPREAPRAATMSVPQETMQPHLAQVTHRKQVMRKLAPLHQDKHRATGAFGLTQHSAKKSCFGSQNVEAHTIPIQKERLKASKANNATQEKNLSHNSLGTNMTNISSQIQNINAQVCGLVYQAIAILRPKTPCTPSPETPPVSTASTPTTITPLPSPVYRGARTQQDGRHRTHQTWQDPIPAKRGGGNKCVYTANVVFWLCSCTICL